MIAGGIAADQKDQIGALYVFECDRCGAGAERRREADAAGLMAKIAAIVDVVRAVQPGKELQQKARLVARPAAEVPKGFSWESAAGACR
jgi:hypothetical protein